MPGDRHAKLRRAYKTYIGQQNTKKDLHTYASKIQKNTDLIPGDRHAKLRRAYIQDLQNTKNTPKKSEVRRNQP